MDDDDEGSKEINEFLLTSLRQNSNKCGIISSNLLTYYDGL